MGLLQNRNAQLIPGTVDMLIEFYEHLKKVQPECAALWKFTGRNPGDQLSFHDMKAALCHDSGTLTLIIVSGTGLSKLYDHVRYLIQELLFFKDEELEINIRGSAYQAIIPLKGIPGLIIDDVFLDGTVAREDRFGNLSEINVRRLYSVKLRMTK